MYEYVDGFAAWQGAKNGDDEALVLSWRAHTFRNTAR